MSPSISQCTLHYVGQIAKQFQGNFPNCTACEHTLVQLTLTHTVAALESLWFRAADVQVRVHSPHTTYTNMRCAVHVTTYSQHSADVLLGILQICMWQTADVGESSHRAMISHLWNISRIIVECCVEGLPRNVCRVPSDVCT